MRPAVSVLLATVLAGAAWGTVPAMAQGRRGGPDPRSVTSFLAGPTWFDIGGTGTGAQGAIRFLVPSRGLVVAEPGIGVFRYTNANDEKITYLLPEVSFLVRPPRADRVIPYAGLGLGLSEFISGRGTTYFSMHATAGLFAFLSEDWGVRVDFRVRTIDPFKQKSADLSFGVARRFGR